MDPIFMACALVILHIFATVWLNNWAFEGSGISDEAYKIKCAELEAEEAQLEPSKVRRFFRDSKPQQRELYRWVVGTAPTPTRFKRRNLISTLCEIPAAVFAIRFLLGEMAVLDMAPMGKAWFLAWLAYDLALLLAGVIYSRRRRQS